MIIEILKHDQAIDTCYPQLFLLYITETIVRCVINTQLLAWNNDQDSHYLCKCHTNLPSKRTQHQGKRI